MSEMTIDEADRDAAVGGGELIPVSDAGSPKSVSVAQIKDYALAQIAALAAADGVNVNADKVYLLKGGALKPLSVQTLAAAVLDYGFGLAGIVTPNGNEVFSTLDNGTKKTITLTQLATYLASHVLIPWGDLTEAANTDALATDDFLVMRDVSATGDKKVKIATLSSYVCAAFKAYVQSLTAIGASDQTETVSTSDTVYIIHGGYARKATVAQLMAASGVGDVTGPQTTTENKIPQWDETAKKLKDGLTLVTTLNAASTNPSDNPPTDTQVPTAAAVRTAIDAAANSSNFVKKTGAETISGVKTFSSSPKVPLSPTANDDVAPKKYVDDAKSCAVLLEGDQTIVGVKTFSATPSIATPMTGGANPVIDTDDDSGKAANTSWVTAKLSAWWTAIKAAAQTISAKWTFSTSPEVPTVADAADNTTKAASTAFVQAVISTLENTRNIVTKSGSSGKFRLDDQAINTFTLEAGANGHVLVEPPTKVTGVARSTVLALTVTGTGEASFQFGFESEDEEDTILGESAGTFTLEAGLQVFYFDEVGANTFFVRRRVFTSTSEDDMFSGTISAQSQE